ncbi:MAG: haloacid dehalogenase type II [Gammaproteobacteria bacterium]
MVKTLAFDIYGTLIDTHGLTLTLQGMTGNKARVFSQLWRDKQLEYSFRRGLMRNYQDFSQCTRDALEYCDLSLGTGLNEQQKQTLLKSYSTLPVFDDVKEGLESLSASDNKLYAFSNGTQSAVEKLLANAGIEKYFIDIVSVDEIKTFKPNPDVYQYFLQCADSQAKESWLISSNAFDITGSISAGMNAAWLQRSPDMIFDPWDIQPTVTITNLQNLDAALQ